MQKEHPLDRLMRRFRGLLILLLFIAAPVMLLSYGWMMVKAYHALPGLLFSIIFIAHLSGWIGVASLLDSRSEQLPPQ